ncbi:peptidoglycan DD-metalloendopeptidase family protein [Vibrio sp. Isolate23]|uniref:murein hydrolase activator EnvC family protein n=1 Tax=Vibrio TaxID=662 RepID=UPI001EFE1766|nr:MULTISPECIES: peptidoglycan DD-metalloendopeptidase family protein [Vibrio]MCG9680372.1 peptidoglycan DD-metalloendopeptidase family protein [Vibrio sp. Isolate24]MCG9684651.1 peptidoglycan DD-metalloendopeptidase family protein [Vibrio sp. Isolate23]USD34104.1 peptidoglycan DD-metalloendopeptidase family protein [Vibrio sp. SCSIO 43186]USD47176.1 peptidoglycan DD-metalloendopeptidase family protein [Vibrio sp. SCSIO 43145]USD71228.1 peptidoglycan DD-metalloendopeptidase family protein [Vib
MATQQQGRLIATSTLSAWVLIVASTLAFPSWSASPNELKGVSSEISRQKQALSSQQKKLDSLQKSLKAQELSIVRLEKEIKEAKEALNKTNHSIATLEKRITSLRQQKQQQSEKLAELLQTYYVTQRAKSSASLLNQGVEEDRISQYFQHLAKQRTITIEKLETTVEQLSESENQLKLEQQQITKLLAQQNQKRQQLSKEQSKRKGTVTSIKKSISSDKVYLTELQRNETRLKAEIAKAAKAAKLNAVPMDGLAKRKGRLPWPLKGKVLHNYGSRQTGQINWKGMVIDANYGQSVKAVYSGTVVFSDYLRGYGLVILLDHGKGDMTLYGFNQSLLKKEGDKVAAGETIALAGDTGGQPQASLYFEIRRNSKTQNPKRWLTR